MVFPKLYNSLKTMFDLVNSLQAVVPAVLSVLSLGNSDSQKP